MVMKVATIDVLTEEAHFEPQVARAIAKAIEMEIGVSSDALATRQDVADQRAAMKQELVELRAATKQELVELRAATKQDIIDLRNELTEKLVRLESSLRLEMRDQKVEVVRFVFLALMGQFALFAGAMYFLLQYVR